MSAFFILQNTQSGKLCQSAKEIQKWSAHKVITFFISSNDRTLIDQSSEGISYFLQQKSNLFILSSNAAIHMEHIKSRIELYAADRLGRHQMPIITALANKQQNARVLELVYFIQQLADHGSDIKYGFIFDEADSTYPILREQTCLLGKKLIHYHSIFVENKKYLHRVGFVTATEGCLVDQDYPECANAMLYQCVKDTFSENHYRAIHTIEAICHSGDDYTTHTTHTTQNDYAMAVIKTHRKHFFGKIKGMYRKIIINSNSQTTDMELVAKECVSMGMNALVFNMNGLSIYNGRPLPEVSVRNKRFNQVVYNTVQQYQLDRKPLVMIGRRKVDRGLSFHYAPRDGSQGLIWTDMIMGHVEDVSLAVQKAGRMAGIIAHCPQYTGECHYWATSETIQKCIDKNRLNDRANSLIANTDFSLVEALRIASDHKERFVERIVLSKKDRKMVIDGKLLAERLVYYVESDKRGSVNSYRMVEDGIEFYHGLELDPRAGIPMVLELSLENVISVTESVLQQKYRVKELLLEIYPMLEEYEFGECAVVDSIDFLVESFSLGRKLEYGVEDKKKNIFHVFLHPVSSRMVLMLWNGTELKEYGSCEYVKSKGKYAGERCGKRCAIDQRFCKQHDEISIEEEEIIIEDELEEIIIEEELEEIVIEDELEEISIEDELEEISIEDDF